ncbi:MAG TPA: RNA polymerase sigma factor [Anseongella sp.]|nr:RNA polymerase sigma factor [Anseongella sp.]
MDKSQRADFGHSWDAFRQGSKQAYEFLYKDHFQSLYEYGARLCEDKALVKDAIQDLFIKLWHSRARLGKVNSVRFYLLVSLRNIIFNKLRQSKRAAPALPYSFELVFSYEQVLIETERNARLAANLTEALNRLTFRQKEAIYLRFYEERSYAETAALMDISVKAVYKIIARALDALKRQFGEEGIKVFLILIHSQPGSCKFLR